jgi:hypothetical protein
MVMLNNLLWNWADIVFLLHKHKGYGCINEVDLIYANQHTPEL